MIEATRMSDMAKQQLELIATKSLQQCIKLLVAEEVDGSSKEIAIINTYHVCNAFMVHFHTILKEEIASLVEDTI